MSEQMHGIWLPAGFRPQQIYSVSRSGLLWWGRLGRASQGDPVRSEPVPAAHCCSWGKCLRDFKGLQEAASPLTRLDTQAAIIYLCCCIAYIYSSFLASFCFVFIFQTRTEASRNPHVADTAWRVVVPVAYVCEERQELINFYYSKK